MYIFYYSGFLSNFALAQKNRVALVFFTVLKHILLFRIFEQLAVALKTVFAKHIISYEITSGLVNTILFL